MQQKHKKTRLHQSERVALYKIMNNYIDFSIKRKNIKLVQLELLELKSRIIFFLYFFLYLLLIN